ncbi:SDR family NAD(P)-dependent oxidoreductase [Amycolatopsis azurea]|uniref:Retinol dehydrogenase 13 (All-trans and 9-cis) n=1 Tax=Amycolatopsis azurea DSM 43854 TaxID=1238180 RepID=M2PX48_9PSEU|nr:SDR family NAD(P)-dependent oxidoreductase [Amycolatopsis azurea]EMD29208.1 retinol dehydrogenase 13 (all-trans and 9-cis) [Amycolatopsis azurea DSM 43854]OOC01943.1 short-chain dehydrogenase [Amycolatopsis azurea DSM 43854]
MNESPTILLTGTSEGIGYETARLLAAKQCTVIVHARTREEGEESYQRLLGSGVDARRFQPAVADFTDLRQVIDLAVEVAELFPFLDVLVNNAGTTGTHGRVITKDGHERTFQVNYLAPYLLTRLLEDALSRSEVGRVVNVSSSLHRGGRINWNDINWKRRYNRGAAYAQSKLALTMMTTALSELRPKVREAVSVHPGIIATGMLPCYSYRGRPVVEGAEPVARLADPGAKVLNGGYYDGRLPAKAASAAVDPDSVRKLWTYSERLTLFDKHQA